MASLVVLAAGTEEGDPTWVTAVVAAASAILGAVVGGLATYAASVRLETRRRRARAAVRRKAKVYTPVRAELLALRDTMASDEHLEWGISLEQDDGRGFARGPRAYRWSQLVADGRAATAASRVARASLERVADSIEHFNRSRESALEVFEVRARPLYLEVMGKELTLVAWPTTGDVAEVVRDRPGAWRIFGVSPVDDPAETEQTLRFRERFNALDEVRRARNDLLAAEGRLSTSIHAAVGELEAAMQRIAAKHEKEDPDD